MYQIAITSRTNNKEVRFSFDTKRIANTWFKKAESKKGMTRNFGASFSNNTIEVSKLY